MKRASYVFAVGALIGLSSASDAEDDPYFVFLGTLGPDYCGSLGRAISLDGRTVVGESTLCGQFRNHAFRWNADAGMEALGTLFGELSSDATACSSSGAVAVGHGVIQGGTEEAFRWDAKQGMTGLGDLPGGPFNSMAWGVSADGRIVVGHSSVEESIIHAFRWTEQAGMVDLGVLPGGWTSSARAISADGRVIVGTSRNADYRNEAIRWTEQEGMVGLGDLDGGSFASSAAAVSIDGSVIVGRGSSDTGWEAYRWTAHDGMMGLGHLNGVYSTAYGVSADGSVVVGGATTPRGRPFVWTVDDGMRNLQDIIQFDYGLELGEFVELIDATGVSADGRIIVGWGFTRNNQAGAWLVYLGPGCRADFNRDGSVDTRDVIGYLNAWSEGNFLADWNYDAVIDTRDVIAFLNDWTRGC